VFALLAPMIALGFLGVTGTIGTPTHKDVPPAPVEYRFA
jgi:hypothetical protein